jgi:hypothetical protein
MAKRATEGEIPDKYLTEFEREMQETTDGKVTKTWTEYARGYVPYGASDEDSAFAKLATKTAWSKDKDSIMGQKLSGKYTHITRGVGAEKSKAHRFQGLSDKCNAGDNSACLILKANNPSFTANAAADKQKLGNIPMHKRIGFAQGGMLDNASKLWKMESTYPEFQKGIANRVSKDSIPTAPIEEQYMYSPIQSGYPQGYAEGGSVYDTEGSMLAPEVPLNFEEEMPAEMPMEAEESEMGLSPEETEVLGQAMSDYPELEDILNKIGSAMDAEFTGEGTVEGPGTETSDSINAKLSDGEFVFTAKAVKQLGVDKLRKMMDKAEGDYDEASTKQEYQQMSDVGFAKGGFFDRPGYNEGDLVTKDEKLQSRLRTPEKGLLGSVVQSIADTANIPRRSITPDDYEGKPAEHRARMKEEAIQAKEQEYVDSLPEYNTEVDDMSPEHKALLDRGNEAIYPEDEYPNQYR